MYIPGWLIFVILLIAFFAMLNSANQYNREKRRLLDKMADLEAELEEEEEKDSGNGFWPEDTRLDPKEYPPET